MRRTLSVILFILGGWVLASEVLVAWTGVGEPLATDIAILAGLLAFSSPFLLLAAWASPGNRLGDLGMTMVIAAGVGTGSALTTFIMLSDPRFLLLLAADSPARNLRIQPVSGALNLLVIGGAGWLLWSSGKRRRRDGGVPRERASADKSR